MKTVQVTLGEDVVNKIAALAYEVQARKSVVAEMLAQNMDTSTSAFLRYQKELGEYTAMYELAKNELQHNYVDTIDGAESWSLDFNSCVLTVTTNGES